MKTRADREAQEYDKRRKELLAKKERLKAKRAARREDHDEVVEATGKCPVKGGCSRCGRQGWQREEGVPWLDGSLWEPDADGTLQPVEEYEDEGEADAVKKAA